MESRAAVAAAVLAAVALAAVAGATLADRPALPSVAPEFRPAVGPDPATDVASEPVPVPEQPPSPADGASAPPGASWEPAHTEPFALAVDGQPATGLVGLPAQEPTTLVVLAHPYGVRDDHYAEALQELAGRGAVAVAMDFRGPADAFKVRAGVEDTVAAALALQERFPSIDRTLLFGHSMGGQVALLAAASAPPGTFDYVFVGAGVSDLEALWHANVPMRPYIESETGGDPTEVPAEFAARSPIQRIDDLAGQGVSRFFVVHGAGDAPVPVDHAEKMYEALSAAGLPVSYYVVTTDEDPLWCVPVMQVCPDVTPASHWAGRFDLMLPFIANRLDRLPDPSEPALRGTYDGDSGSYEPSDVG